MKPFAAPVDDILFSLNHVAGATRLPDWDQEFTSEIARHFAAFAEGEIASLDEAGDQQGCRLEKGRVHMPDGFSALYRSFAEQGWQGLTAPETYGGQALGDVMLAITTEIFTGANHSLQMVTGLVPGAIRTLLNFGTDDQKSRFLPPLVSGDMLATMCLTESNAGSDLSQIRCKAIKSEDGWQIEGEKIFISGGDQDISDHILHLVLARTSDDGVKGLSLFLCPCTLSNGERNTISVTRIEEKMGLHASPTCQLAFDNAQAELIGTQGQGLVAMFTMMNHARADVALQGVAHAARAYDIASSYAVDRVQGKGPDGSSVTLDQHADVRRMVDEIDAMAVGGRAIAHIASVTMEQGDSPDLVEFLTPLAKVYCTDAGIRSAELAMQVLGGYGYLQEYRLEQTYRDARITAIYEGANGIHERMIATRLLKGRAADAFDAYVSAQAITPLAKDIVEKWKQARRDLLAKKDPTPYAHDFTGLASSVLLSCLWGIIDAEAEHHPDPKRIRRLVKQTSVRLHATGNMQVQLLKT